MIAPARKAKRRKLMPPWHAGFLAMMPDILRYFTTAFRFLSPDAYHEAVQETLVSAMLAYVSLFERGKVDLAYPSVLARFAVAQYRVGRRVGARLNRNDVLSAYARRTRNIIVESLDHDRNTGLWREILVEDKHAGPPDTAAARIDFPAWLRLLSRRDRKIAETLSLGGTTSDAARRFQVTPGRISQMRREFLESWNRFHGEPLAVSAAGEKTNGPKEPVSFSDPRAVL